jgi:CelD/BcsL family acetyltransferase involved in cellulose biosynthesis
LPGGDRRRLSLRIVEDLDALPQVEDAWRALRDEYGIGAPNSEPALFTATVRSMGDAVSPHVVVIADDRMPRAIVIGRRSIRRARIRVGHSHVPSPRLRCLDVVYDGLITDGSAAAAGAVRAHLSDLIASRSVDLVTINAMPVDHEVSDRISCSHTLGADVHREAAEPHWRFAFADGSFDKTIGRFSRKHRYNIRRTDRLLSERFDGQLELRPISSADELPGFLREADSILASSYQHRLTGGWSTVERLNAVLRAAAERGQLCCFALHGRGRAIAFQKGVICGDCYWLLSTAFDANHRRHSPGRVLLVRAMEHLHALGISAIDYGFGDAAYKRMYGTECQHEVTLQIHGRTHSAQIARYQRSLIEGAVSRAQWVAERFGVSNTMRRIWRAHLEDSGRGGGPGGASA